MIIFALAAFGFTLLETTIASYGGGAFSKLNLSYDQDIQDCFSNKSYTFNAMNLFVAIYKNGAKKNVAIE